MSKPGRNDPCHCGSGQKYKKCHLSADDTAKSAEFAAAALASAAAAAAAEAAADAEEAESGKESPERQAAVRGKDAGASRSRAPAPTQAPAFRRKSV